MTADITFDFTTSRLTSAWLHHEEAQALRQAGWDRELILKYGQYLERTSAKNCRAMCGRTADSDSQRSKVYIAEGKYRRIVRETEGLENKRFTNLEEAQQRLSQIIESKTWEKVADGAPPRKWIKIRMKKSRVNSGFGGIAYSHGLIKLASHGLNEHVLLHELAHVAGNPHHDVTFRIALVNLVSAFMGVEYAKILKKCFREQKLKMTKPKVTKFKQPGEWLAYHERMKKARACRSK